MMSQSQIQWCPTECVNILECDQVQQYTSTPIMSRQKEVRLRNKERKRDFQELQAKSNPLDCHDALKTTKYLQAFH